MVPESTDEPAVTFTRFTRDWFRLLARGAFGEAAALLDEPNSYGEKWTADKIRSVLRDHARPEPVAVSDPDTLDGDGRPSLVALADGHGFSFEHDLPLGGVWSDLTAQFEFLRRPDGYAVVLHDIHVL